MGDEFITSGDFNGSVPEGPRGQNSSWPTPSNIYQENATDFCYGAIRASPLYVECLQYTDVDTMDYVNSCVADILVTELSIYCIYKCTKLQFIHSLTAKCCD